jgi:signal transduction histidine kinase
MVVDRRALGVVSFSFGAARSFNTEEQSFLLTLAHLSAQALARTHYCRQLERRDKKHVGELQALTAALQHEVSDRAAIQAQLSKAIHKLRLYSAELNLAREKEGKRLAVEIHDQLGGSLTGLKMDVALLRRTLGSREPVALERLGAMSGAIDSTIALVRQIATDLRPSILDELGLLAALDWAVDEFRKRSGVASEFIAHADADALDNETATVIFRVVQESLTNIARHAEATRVVILIEAEPQALVVQVHDNGRGFAYSKLAEAHSLGLMGMQERVRAVAGKLDIETAPGQGTTVWIKVPSVHYSGMS